MNSPKISKKLQRKPTFTTSRIGSYLSINSERSHPKGFAKRNSQINSIQERFMSINSQIEIEHDQSAFNLIEYERPDKRIQFDSTMVTAKLKRLENDAQLKRINMELDSRTKNVQKTKNINQVLPPNQSYLNSFRQFKTQRQKSMFLDNHNEDSEEEVLDLVKHKQNGVQYYNSLKKHPRLLDFTLQRIKQKEVENEEIKNVKKKEQEKVKKLIQAYGLGLQQEKQKKTETKKTEQSQVTIEQKANPEIIADNIFRKLYTKKNKQKSLSQLRGNNRCIRVIDKQDRIFENIDQKSLSKQNYKKLKGRFQSILNQIYSCDKRKKKVFPEICRMTAREIQSPYSEF